MKGFIEVHQVDSNPATSACSLNVAWITSVIFSETQKKVAIRMGATIGNGAIAYYVHESYEQVIKLIEEATE